LRLYFRVFDTAIHVLGEMFMAEEGLLTIKDGESIVLIEG